MTVDALSRLLDVILDDLSARFIINLPEEELSSVTRICFGLEQAHWFYEDFFRPQHPTLPSVNLRAFTTALFSHCPLLWKFSGQHEAAFDDFLKYKTRVPVRGVIMLNDDMDKCVLVKGWKSSASWGFPKGKIDQGEEDANCAVREVREECGFDTSKLLNADEFIDVVMREQTVRLYVVAGVPMDTKFEPQTRKEISKIDWFPLNDLPTYRDASEKQTGKSSGKYYMVAPFVGPLRKWIKRQKSKGKKDTGTATDKTVEELKSDKVLRLAPEHDVESSSQALKLLLGIVDEPTETVSASSAEVEDSNTSPTTDKSRIDLATLFQKPAIRGTSAPGSRPRQPSVPMNLLNTNIETSILEQLEPARQQPFMGPFDHAPHGIAAPSRPANFQYSTVLPPHLMPQFASQSMMLPTPPPDYRNMLHGPAMPIGLPGFLYSQPHQFTNTSGSSPKANPNASSLLALLKPGASKQSNSPQDLMLRFGRSEIPPVSSPNFTTGPGGVVEHKQSLLDLLRPTSSSKQDYILPSNVTAVFPAGIGSIQAQPERTTAKEAFLLDYLTQAATRSNI